MIVMLIDVWDLQAIEALDDELDFRTPSGQRANVAESRVCSVDRDRVNAVDEGI